MAMLRGINVSGRNPLAMDDLRASWRRAGGADVRTYIQSGNAVFAIGRAAPPVIVRPLPGGSSRRSGPRYRCSCGRTAELVAVVETNPFSDGEGRRPST